MKVTTSGNVTNAQALVDGSGTATLTNVAGQAPPVIVLDYGKEVGGLPFFGVSSVSPVAPATSVTMRAGYSEAQQYVLGAAPTTTLTSAAAVGDTNVKVAGTTNFFPGASATIDGEQVTLTNVGSAAASDTSLAAPAAAGDTNVSVNGVNGYAVGAPLKIDGETTTITAVGSAAGTPTTLSSPLAGGATNVKVNSVAGFAAGQRLVIDRKDAESSDGVDRRHRPQPRRRWPQPLRRVTPTSSSPASPASPPGDTLNVEIRAGHDRRRGHRGDEHERSPRGQRPSRVCRCRRTRRALGVEHAGRGNQRRRGNDFRAP